MSVTILFRGLMVFHKQGDLMELGFLNAPGVVSPPPPTMEATGHIPRISTIREGVISSVFDLRNRPELGSQRDWQLEVTNPLQPTASEFIVGDPFRRLTHTEANDFRWIADLEGTDLHDRELTSELNKASLKFVLTVRNGQFYTAVKSRSLRRISVNGGPPVRYGCGAEVMACDIRFNIGEVRLRAGGSAGTIVFRFTERAERGVIYEFSNNPPDVPTAAPPNQPYRDERGHFHMYYHHLFRRPPRDEFDLMPEIDPDPAPDPFLCGAVRLSRSRESLLLI